MNKKEIFLEVLKYILLIEILLSIYLLLLELINPEKFYIIKTELLMVVIMAITYIIGAATWEINEDNKKNKNK